MYNYASLLVYLLNMFNNNPTILLEVSVTTGIAERTEQRKHCSNDGKCNDLGWVCVPLVVESYGAWGKEALESISQLAS